MDIVEIPTSREIERGDKYSRTFRFKVFPTQSEDAAEAFFVSRIPAIRAGLVYQSHTVREAGDLDTWDCSVTYGERETQATRDIKPEVTGDPVGEGDQQPISSSVHIDLTGESVHITRSRATVKKYPADATDYNRAINVSKDAVEGLDIELSAFSFTKPKVLHSAVVTTGWLRSLMRMGNAINDRPFLGFDKGEVQFAGGVGDRNGFKWDFSFRFNVKQNEFGVRIPVITSDPNQPGVVMSDVVVDKEGWQYIWSPFTQVVINDKFVAVAEAVYVEEIFPYANFNILGLT